MLLPAVLLAFAASGCARPDPKSPRSVRASSPRKTYGTARGIPLMKESEVTATWSLTTLAGAEWVAVAIDGGP